MNSQRINPDDPKWTAFVLGELEGAERAEVEHLLETSEEARALVEDLRMATGMLKEELTPEIPLTLSAEQQAAIRAAVTPGPRRWFEKPAVRWAVPLAAAAVVLLAVWAGQTPEPGSALKAVGEVAAVLPSDARDPVSTAESNSAEQQAQAPAGRATEAKALVSVEPPISVEEFAERAQDGAPSNPTGALAAGTRTPSLSGNVSDSSGALIPGVTVIAKDLDTGITRTTVTSTAGTYALPALPPGKYEVSATLPGFRTQVSNLEVRAENERQDMKLQVAGASTQVAVSIEAGRLSKSAASVGQVVPGQANDLPLVGNNVLDLVTIAPLSVSTPTATVAGLSQSQVTTARDGLAVGQGQGGGAGAGGGGGGGRGARGAAAGTGAGGGIGQGQGQQGQVRGGVFTEARERAAAPPPPAPVAPPVYYDVIRPPAPNTEAYDRITDNPFIRTSQENLATFSIDVDTASYANVRRFLNQNQLPPKDAVRIEEMINYFSYDYAQPSGNAPINPNMEVAAAPWAPQNRLVRIGIKAREINSRRPPSNLVFLIDVSGSMTPANRLPLVKDGLKMLVNRLGENDTVSIVVYAGASGLVLPPTSGMRKEVIQQAIDSLQPGGSTNGASGIQLAYNQAVVNFIRGGVNRVILMTDGDFNVGITNQGDLTRLIQERAKSGVFLSVLGFGMGNIKDSTLEKLADEGNGHYAYIDSINEARKVLVEEMDSTLVTVAKDVKIQVDFNPQRVEAYRLIGYENRVLRTEDFNNDQKDAGDMGAGHTVTALFEVVPKGGSVPGPSIDPSKYTQAPGAREDAQPARPNASSNEMLNLRVRYKLPESDTSTRMDVPLVDRGNNFARASQDFRFAASVAQFGMILRESPYRGSSSIESVQDIAEGSRGQDRSGYRSEFISLVQRTQRLLRSLGR